MKKKKASDIRLDIVRHLRKADKPLIAHHIAIAIKLRPQLLDYHLKILIKQGIILVTREYGHYYYFLQPYFYLEEAETALMQIMLPWVEEFSKQTEISEQNELTSLTKSRIVLNNLKYYLDLFLENNLEEIPADKTNPLEKQSIDKNHFSDYTITDSVKEQIRKRDKYTCQECGKHQSQLKRQLNVHHIDYDKSNNSPTNLISLCNTCNIKANENRSYWTKHFQQILEDKGSYKIKKVSVNLSDF